jgi:hypothetical protein
MITILGQLIVETQCFALSVRILMLTTSDTSVQLQNRRTISLSKAVENAILSNHSSCPMVPRIFCHNELCGSHLE